MPHVPVATFGIADSPCIHCSAAAGTLIGRPINTAIDKEDCAYCCNTNAHGCGVFICMTCKECMCYDHIPKHISATGGDSDGSHQLYVKYYKLPDRVKEGEAIDNTTTAGSAEFIPTTGDVNSVGIADAPAYDSRCVCYGCQVFFVEPSAAVVTPEVAQGFTAIVHATPKAAVAGADAAGASGDVDDPYRNSIICKHTREYQQSPSPFNPATNPIPADPATLPCHQCPCNKNNWICMTCGTVGCPRKEGGGNEHAIAHFKATGHPVVLKLGTVTTKGADMYCYACDEEVKDPSLKARLAHFGINMDTAVKTSKSLGEMMYDLTMAADLQSICEVGADGKSLVEPVVGRAGGFMGLHNFGNTCYMNSVVQLLLRSAPWQQAFLGGASCGLGGGAVDEAALVAARDKHTAECTSTTPRTCFMCQWLKVATALFSVRFANTLEGHAAAGTGGVDTAMVSEDYLAEEGEKKVMYEDFVVNVLPADPSAKMDKSLLPRKKAHNLATLNGATPRDFKVLNARGNKEFLGGQQQDALEYLSHMCEGVVANGATTASVMVPFAIESVNKKQCISCQRVKYQRTREDILRLPTPMTSEDYVAAAAKLSAEAAEKDAAAKDGSGAKTSTAPERPRVALSSLLEAYVAPKMTECRCESCGDVEGGYFCSSNLFNYPEYLIMSIPREYIDPTTYTTKKMDVYVDVPEEIDLAMMRGPGVLQPGEEPLASHTDNAVERGGLRFADGGETSAGSASGGTNAKAVEVDELSLVQLLSMGIEQPAAEWALRKCNNNVEQAIDYVFSHPEGPAGDEVAVAAAPSAAPSSASAALAPLTDAPARSQYKVLGMVSHVGASAVTGHYVCHLKKEDGSWYLFNDEKVGRSVKPPLDLGTFYLLERKP